MDGNVALMQEKQHVLTGRDDERKAEQILHGFIAKRSRRVAIYHLKHVRTKPVFVASKERAKNGGARAIMFDAGVRMQATHVW